MRKLFAMFLALIVIIQIIPSSCEAASTISISGLEKCIKNIFEDTEGEFKETVNQQGEIEFNGIMTVSTFFQVMIQGYADKDRNVKAFAYIIPVTLTSALDAFETMTVDSLKKDMENSKKLPMGRLNMDMFLMGYGKIMAFLAGERRSDDYYGMENLFKAREETETINDWLYSVQIVRREDRTGVIAITAIAVD